MTGKVVIAGGTGFVGSILQQHLGRLGFSCLVLTRSARAENQITWDGRASGDWTESLEDAVAVINLCGSSIARKWTAENKRSILDSRVEPTRAIGKAIAACSSPPSLWINGSAIGYYGDTGEQDVDEQSPSGTGFLAETCIAWERAVDENATPQTRRVVVRIGNVLGREGGMLPLLIRLTKWFLGGSVADGKQWISWIHEGDLARIVQGIIESDIEGCVNATTAAPVRNGALMQDLRKLLRRPWSPPVPKLALRFVNALGGPDPSLALLSQKVAPTKMTSNGFEFDFPLIELALKDLLAR